MGAGSDAHVLQGVGTGAVRMRAFRDPEEFLISLRSAEILRRPKSLAYLQGLKWMAQVKERTRRYPKIPETATDVTIPQGARRPGSIVSSATTSIRRDSSRGSVVTMVAGSPDR